MICRPALMFGRIKPQRYGNQNHHGKRHQCQSQSDGNFFRHHIRYRHAVAVGCSQISPEHPCQPARIPHGKRAVQSHFLPQRFHPCRSCLRAQLRSGGVPRYHRKGQKHQKGHHQKGSRHGYQFFNHIFHVALTLPCEAGILC